LDIEKAKNKLFLGNGNLVNAADKIVQLGAKEKAKLKKFSLAFSLYWKN